MASAIDIKSFSLVTWPCAMVCTDQVGRLDTLGVSRSKSPASWLDSACTFILEGRAGPAGRRLERWEEIPLVHAKVNTLMSTAQMAEDGAATAGLLAAAPPPGRTRGIADLGGRARASSPPCSTLGRPPCQPTRRSALTGQWVRRYTLASAYGLDRRYYASVGGKPVLDFLRAWARGAYWLRGEVSMHG